MAQICPQCQGLVGGCPVCNAPPRRSLPRPSKIQRLIAGIATPQFTKNRVVAIDLAPTWGVNGVDISAWNGSMNLAVTKKKAQYGFIRLGYGNDWKDKRADENRQKALDNDWPYGVYWYCYPGYSWQLHAEGFAEVIHEFPYQLDVVIDAEQTALGKEATLEWLIKLDDRLQVLTGKIPIIYTAKYFWDTKVARSDYFSGRTNWIANWTTASSPYMPLDLPKWGHWQWSADNNFKGPEYGAGPDGDADMDLNRFNGTAKEFDARYGTHIADQIDPPIEPPSVISPIKYVYVTADSLNLRSSPGDLSPQADIGTLRYGSDVPVIEEKGGWYRIEGWIAGAYTRKK